MTCRLRWCGQTRDQMSNSNMANVWAYSMACHPRATCHVAGYCQWWIQRHVIPEPRITLQGAPTRWIHCHDSRATCYMAGCSHLAKSMSWSCHIAGCNNSIHHIENRLSPYFIFYFLMEFGLWRAAAFVSSPIHLFTDATQIFPSMQRHLVPVKLHAFHGLRNVLPNFWEFIGYCCTALFVISVLPRRSCVIVAVCLFVCLSRREQDNSQTHLPNTAVMTQGDPVEVITLCCSSGSGYACMNQFFTFFKIGR